MIVAALRHRGGFALLDVLQPCPTYNHLNTYQWYRERVKAIADTHEPFDRAKALELAYQWGDEIPIGILYLSRRPTFESQQPALQAGTLVAQYRGAAH